jgi:hypothetical protein
VFKDKFALKSTILNKKMLEKLQLETHLLSRFLLKNFSLKNNFKKMNFLYHLKKIESDSMHKNKTLITLHKI